MAEDIIGDNDLQTLVAALIYGCALAPMSWTCGAVAEDLCR